MPAIRNKRALRGLVAGTAGVLFLVPVVTVGWLCATGPEIPQNDYWIYLGNIASKGGLSHDLADWGTRHNHHLLAGTYLLYALNLVVTHGSNRGLAVMAWLFATGSVAVILSWLPGPPGVPRPEGRWAAVFVAWMVFSPLLGMLWVMGFAGVHVLGTTFLCLLAIAAWRRCGGRWGRWLLVWMGALAVATSTFSAAIGFLPAMALAVLFRMRDHCRRQAIIPLTFVGLLAAVWLLGYDPGAGGRLLGSSATLAPLAVLAHVGSVFTRQVEAAVLLGLVGLVGLCALALKAWHADGGLWRGRDEAWWLVLGFALSNTMLVAVTRGTAGVERVFASRHMVYPVLFWVSIGCLTAQWSVGAGRWARRLTATALVSLVALTHYNGLTYLRALVFRAQLEPAARIAFHMGIVDREAIRGVITPWVQTFTRLVPVLRANGWVPFEKRTALGGFGACEAARGEVAGLSLWHVRPMGGPAYRLAGRLSGAMRPGTRLRVVDGSGRVIGGVAAVETARGPSRDKGVTVLGYVLVSWGVEADLVGPDGIVRGSVRLDLSERSIAPDLDPYWSRHRPWYAAGEYCTHWLEARAGMPRSD
jgi:hypothetical protein